MNINLTLPRLNTTTMQVLVVLFYSYVLIFHIKDTEYAKMLILTFLTMVLCSIMNILEAFTTVDPEGDDKIGPDDPKNITYDTNETSAPATDEAAGTIIPTIPEVPKVAPPTTLLLLLSIKGNMSVYDGICLQTGNSEPWMKSQIVL